jgi:ferritin-like metal-binding protein YciE
MANITRPQDLFTHKLDVALQMERTVVTMLRQLEGKASDPELKQMLSHHRDETEQQITNLEQAFSALGADAQGHKSPAIDGIRTEGEELLGKVADELVDSVILGGAATTEHHEISVYESLITQAEAMGEDDVVALLEENLDIEKHTLSEVQKKAEEHTKQTVSAS